MDELDDLFDCLYEEFMRPVYGYFAVCFNRDIAEDLTQQVFMKVSVYLRNHPYFFPDNKRAWIFRIVINVKNDYLRSVRDEKQEAPLIEGITDDKNMIENKALSVDVKNMLECIPVDDKRVLLLKYMGYTSKEIAELMEITDSAVRSRISVAKQRLKNVIDSMDNSYDYIEGETI